MRVKLFSRDAIKLSLAKDTTMRQAIVTKWLGATNTLPSRVKASADAGSIVVPWNHSLRHDENHAAAAEALAKKLDWISDDMKWQGGSLPGKNSSGYCFVAVVSLK